MTLELLIPPSNLFWDTLYVFDQTKVNKKDGATSPLAPLDLTLDRHQADRRLVILDRETFPRRRTSDQNNCSGREGSHQTNNVIRSIYNRVSHITPFFELSYTLLTTHALGLYEVTKKISAL